jgi:23S rRNA (pseudouridine1915-N3)-methyltransferase
MKIAIIAVGKLKQPGLRALVDDYLDRVRRHVACDEIELKDAPERELLERFERAIPAKSVVVALEIEGRTHDSQGFARWLGKFEYDAVGHLAFLIGGAYGLPKAVSQAAQFRLSLSEMTLPHRLARVVLAEQIYRAFTILRNEPYNH